MLSNLSRIQTNALNISGFVGNIHDIKQSGYEHFNFKSESKAWAMEVYVRTFALESFNIFDFQSFALFKDCDHI